MRRDARSNGRVSRTLEAVSDGEIDRMIAAEETVEKARESQQMSALRAELNALKGEGQQKETK